MKRILLLAMGILLFTSNAYANRLYTCGFEMQSVTDTVEWVDTVWPVAIDTTTKRSGLASMRATVVSSSAYLKHTFCTTSHTNSIYARFYLYIHTSTNALREIAKLNSGVDKVVLRLNSNNTLELWDYVDTLQEGADSPTLTSDTWYRIELAYDYNSFTATAYIDGVQFATGTIGAASTILSYLFLGASAGSTTADLYYDDVAVNNSAGTYQTTLPGAGSIVLALPNAAGDNNPTAGLFSYINEIPPSNTCTAAPGGTDMIELDANPTIGDYRMTDSVDLGIGSSDTITLVDVKVRAREEAAGTSNYTNRIKSQDGGTVLASTSADGGSATVTTNPPTATTFYTNLVSYVDPQAAGAWTPALIDTMQVGVATTDGTPNNWIPWLGAMIEYIPSGAPPPSVHYNILRNCHIENAVIN